MQIGAITLENSLILSPKVKPFYGLILNNSTHRQIAKIHSCTYIAGDTDKNVRNIKTWDRMSITEGNK